MSRENLLESGRQRRLDRAITYCSDYWLPINRNILKKISRKFEQDGYNSLVDTLVLDLQEDLSLFTFCFREVLKKLTDEGVQLPETPNPLSVFQLAGYEQLREILALEGGSHCSHHSIGDASGEQIARLEEALVSASAAEVLSENVAIDSSTAFSSALLRQFGLSLIAWNYPGLYQEAISTLTAETTLDELLAKRLGFSPLSLTVRMLNNWGLSKESCHHMGLIDDQDSCELNVNDSLSMSLVEICKIGEALARSQHPDIYPTAQRDWEFARQEVHRHLGLEGLDRIKAAYQQHIEMYLSIAPEVFEGDWRLEGIGTLSDAATTENPWFINPHYLTCSPKLQTQLRMHYPLIAKNKRSPELVRSFLNSIMPEAGFSGGAVFTLEPGVMILLPQARFGSIELHSLERVEYSLVKSNGDTVALAYQSVDTVVCYGTSMEGRSFATLAGAFGRSDRVGVLYAEMPYEQFSVEEDRHLSEFNALICTLNDTLALT